MQKPKIAVLGGGMFGMVSSLKLAQEGFDVLLIEKMLLNKHNLEQDVRTTATTPATKRFLQELDFFDEIDPILGKIKFIYVLDNTSPGMISFSDKYLYGVDEDIGYIFKNSELKNILYNKIQKTENIELIDNVEYDIIHCDEEKVQILIDYIKLFEVDLVIFSSPIEPLIYNRFFSVASLKEYGQTAITFLVRHDLSHNGVAIEHFLHLGPFAILPLKDSNSSSVVWSVSIEYAKCFVQLPLVEAKKIIQGFFGSFLGRIDIISKMMYFPLKAILAPNYFYKKLVLCGAAAHVIHPLAGQNFNQSIKDLQSLIIASKDNFSYEALKKYQDVRKKDNLNMFFLTDNINSIFSNKSCILFFLRKIGFKLIENIAEIKRSIISYAGGRR